MKLQSWLVALAVASAAALRVHAATNAPANTAVFTVPVREFTSSVGGQVQDGYWKITETGQVTAVFYIPTSAVYTIKVMARGEYANRAWPIMVVGVDGRMASRQTVNYAKWAPYTFTTPIARGNREISIGYVNDYSHPPEDRNLWLDSISLAGPSNRQTVILVSAEDNQGLQDEGIRQWQNRVDEGLDNVRKGLLVVWVTDEKGEPMSDVRVSVRQIRHEFPFGSSICPALFEAAETNREGLLYRAHFKRFFNSAGTGDALAWKRISPNGPLQTDYAFADRIVDWCASNRIVLRGEEIFSGCAYPGWAQALPDDELRAAMERRTKDIVTRYQNRIVEYDLLDEPLKCPVSGPHLSTSIDRGIVNTARDAHPLAIRCIGASGILEGAGLDPFVQYIRQQRESGAGIGGIALRARFEREADPVQLLYALDVLAQFELPVKIVDFECAAPDPAARDRCMETVFRTAFSHPAVSGIMMEGFWASCQKTPASALLTSDFRKTNLADTYERLVFGEWWSAADGLTDSVGRFEHPCFFGNYNLDIVTGSGQSTSMVAHLSQADGALTLNFEFKRKKERKPAPAIKPRRSVESSDEEVWW